MDYQGGWILYKYIDFRLHWHVRIFWKMSETILFQGDKKDIESILKSYQNVIAVDLVNFSSNQIKFYPHSRLCHLMMVGRKTKRQREKDRKRARVWDASAGPCCEIKGHTLWIGNPNSHLLSCWPVGKSNAIRPEKRPLSSWSLSSKSSAGLQSIISPLHLTLHQPCVKRVHWWQCVRPHWWLQGGLRRKERN